MSPIRLKFRLLIFIFAKFSSHTLQVCSENFASMKSKIQNFSSKALIVQAPGIHLFNKNISYLFILKMKTSGFVTIVGGGPGDPELMTLKGKKALERAEVIIYDALIDSKLLKFSPARSKKIYVGKRRHRHHYEQNEINELMLKCAQEGKVVCRLKGGDPFLFGRGAEEAEFLVKHGVRVEIIPGISSVIAVPESVGIPLTHRDYASSVTVATGHKVGAKKGKDFSEDWSHYAPRKSVVLLMGFARLKEIVRELLHSGWPSQTPIALICSGTLPHQFCLTATLKTILSEISKKKNLVSSPAMIVVGEVVQVRKKIYSK